MKDFFHGFEYAVAGFKLIKEPSVRKYVMIPMFINIVIFSLGLWYAISAFNSAMQSLVPSMFPDSLNLSSWLSWLESAYQWFLSLFGWVEYLLWSLFAIFYLLIVFYGFTIVANLISAPFNGFFSAAVERLLLDGEVDPGHVERSVAEEVKIALIGESRKLLYTLKCLIPLLLLFLVLFFLPPANSLIPFIWFLFGAWMLSINYADYPMANHGLVFNQEKDILKQRRRLSIGFGSAIMLMTMVPVLNFFAVPVGVAGATKLFHERLREDTEAKKLKVLD